MKNPPVSLLVTLAVALLSVGCHDSGPSRGAGYTNQGDRNACTRAVLSDVRQAKLRYMVDHYPSGNNPSPLDTLTNNSDRYHAIETNFMELISADYDRPVGTPVPLLAHISYGLGTNAVLIIGDTKTEPSIIYTGGKP